nr:putative RNA-directed DNA polymerase [Tanacetum cinerariifolium]
MTKGYRRNDGKKKWVTRDDKSHLKCEECGISRHTKEQCFRIVSYPDWWTDGNKKGTKSAKPEKENVPTTNTSSINKEKTSDGWRSDGGFGGLATAGNKGIGGDFSIAEESFPNQNTTSAGAQEQSSPNISATEDTFLNLISEEHEEPTLTEVPEKYVLPARSNRGIPPKRYTLEKTSKKQALKSEKWNNDMDVEMDVLMRNGTWDKCILPQGKKPVGCRWIFTIKYKRDVAKLDTIRVLFLIAVNQGWPLHQFDVKNAFLHGKLKEEVYMEAPPGFSQHFKHGEVCKLKKSLYGLKQSPRAWFGRFILAMKKYRYKQSNLDHILFLRHIGDRVTCLIIYVDDMIITGNDESEIKKLKEGLCAEFKMKDLGNLRYFLGIEVMRSPHGIFICQKKYILDLLAETRMIDCKPADTPMITNQKLFMKTKAKLDNRDMYQRMVGKLINLSYTRSDIAYAVGVVSQFMHQPQVDHMHAVLRIVRYLKGTTSHGVLFKTNGHLNIQIFTDADWAGVKGNKRSTSGYFSLVGGLVEALWIRKLVSETGFSPKESIRIMSDNKADIQISENLVQHDRTKHVEVDRYFIKEKLEAGIIKLAFVKSEDRLADILTKAVGMVILHKCLNKLNFGDLTIQLEGECYK